MAGSDTLRGPDGHRARPEVVPELHEAVDERDGEEVVLNDRALIGGYSEFQTFEFSAFFFQNELPA